MVEPTIDRVKVEISEARSLTRHDLSSWLKTAIVFTIPVWLIYFTAVQAAFSNGFEWSDFIPNQLTQGSIVGWVLSQVLALLRKWGTEKIYPLEPSK